jgi:hypothetical protein
MVIPTGKGLFIWKLGVCAGGDMRVMANMALSAHLDWVAIKAADGKDNFNQANPANYGPDLLGAAVDNLHSVGIKVWFWQYVYGANTLRQSIAAAEANRIVDVISRFHPEGLLIDAEAQYKRSGAAAWADTYMTILRSSFPTLPIGLCSYRFPTLHPELPWQSFLRRCNFHTPQVYWLLAHNPGDQMGRSVRELKALANLPVVPVGAAYYDTGYKWQPTVAELNEFDRVAHALKLPGLAWWEWGENGHGAQYIAEFWEAITRHEWGDPVLPPQKWDESITAWARTMGYSGPGPG